MNVRAYFTTIFMLVIPSIIFSFEFFDIKSGMSKEEIKPLIFYEQSQYKHNFDDYGKIYFPHYKDFQNKFDNYPATSAHFLFTSQDKLWKIELFFPKPKPEDKILRTAFLNAISKYFPNGTITEYIEKEKYFDTEYWVVQLIDNGIFDEDVKSNEEIFLKLLNHSSNN